MCKEVPVLSKMECISDERENVEIYVEYASIYVEYARKLWSRATIILVI